MSVEDAGFCIREEKKEKSMAYISVEETGFCIREHFPQQSRSINIKGTQTVTSPSPSDTVTVTNRERVLLAVRAAAGGELHAA